MVPLPLGHSPPDMIGTIGGGVTPWTGTPSTKAQKRLPAYALYTIVKKSGIPNAGLGLFLLEDAKRNDRVAVYSGEVMTRAQKDASNSRYIFEVNTNFYLDAADPKYEVGRFINAGGDPGHPINVTFGSRRTATLNRKTDHYWVSITAKHNIKAGTELLLGYRSAYQWNRGERQSSAQPAMLQLPASEQRDEAKPVVKERRTNNITGQTSTNNNKPLSDNGGRSFLDQTLTDNNAVGHRQSHPNHPINDNQLIESNEDNQVGSENKHKHEHQLSKNVEVVGDHRTANAGAGHPQPLISLGSGQVTNTHTSTTTAPDAEQVVGVRGVATSRRQHRPSIQPAEPSRSEPQRRSASQNEDGANFEVPTIRSRSTPGRADRPNGLTSPNSPSGEFSPEHSRFACDAHKSEKTLKSDYGSRNRVPGPAGTNHNIKLAAQTHTLVSNQSDKQSNQISARTSERSQATSTKLSLEDRARGRRNQIPAGDYHRRPTTHASVVEGTSPALSSAKTHNITPKPTVARKSADFPKSGQMPKRTYAEAASKPVRAQQKIPQFDIDPRDRRSSMPTKAIGKSDNSNLRSTVSKVAKTETKWSVGQESQKQQKRSLTPGVRDSRNPSTLNQSDSANQNQRSYRPPPGNFANQSQRAVTMFQNARSQSPDEPNNLSQSENSNLVGTTFGDFASPGIRNDAIRTSASKPAGQTWISSHTTMRALENTNSRTSVPKLVARNPSTIAQPPVDMQLQKSVELPSSRQTLVKYITPNTNCYSRSDARTLANATTAARLPIPGENATKMIANQADKICWPNPLKTTSRRPPNIPTGTSHTLPRHQFAARTSSKHPQIQEEMVLATLRSLVWPASAHLSHTARAARFRANWTELHARFREHMPPMPTICRIVVDALKPWELHYAVTTIINQPYGWQPLALSHISILRKVIDHECERLDNEAAAMNPRRMPRLPIVALVKYGDITTAPDDILVHQTNCVSCRPKGLARYMFRVFPYANTYKQRGPHATPGTVIICGTAAHKRWIANMNAQYYPGPPSKHGKDDRQHRLQYFEQCLQALGQHIHDAHAHPCSVAFPWRIGCGLAQGTWRLYSTLIMRWSSRVRTLDGHAPRVSVYQLHPDS